MITRNIKNNINSFTKTLKKEKIDTCKLRTDSKSSDSLKSILSVCSINSLESIELLEPAPEKNSKNRRKRDDSYSPKLSASPSINGIMHLLESTKGIDVGLPID